MKVSNLILISLSAGFVKQTTSDEVDDYEGHNTDWYNSVDDIYSDPLYYDRERYVAMKKYEKELKTALVTSKPVTKPVTNCLDQCAARCGKPVKKSKKNFIFIIII